MTSKTANAKNEAIHTIDATDRSIGHVASEAARALMGKDSPDYAPNEIADALVRVTNCAHLSIRPAKKTEKVYMSYSGYPGGRIDRQMQKIIDEKGYGEVVRRAVYGMLPANRLRKRIMKNLIVEEENE